MKNITVSVVLRPNFDGRKRLERETLMSVREFSGGDRLPREAVHKRYALR